jgi:hypothetical protein
MLFITHKYRKSCILAVDSWTLYWYCALDLHIEISLAHYILHNITQQVIHWSTQVKKKNNKTMGPVSTLPSAPIDWSDWLVWPDDFYWPGVFILQTDAKSIQKHTKLIENRFSRSKFNWLIVGTSQKALERLALRQTLRFHSWRWKG